MNEIYPYIKWYFMRTIFAIGILFLCISCGGNEKQMSIDHQSMKRAFITGSAESPDPVLVRVRELEGKGIVKDVVVYESFPVRISLSAPKKVIDELSKIPRLGGLH
jgi:hypothetical protein